MSAAHEPLSGGQPREVEAIPTVPTTLREIGKEQNSREEGQ